jgi:hypothetical protein
MPTKKKAASIFDISRVAPEARYHWREIEREDRDPLRVKCLDLNIAQTEAIPYGMRTPMKDAFAVIWPYVVEWDLRMVNKETGEVVDVPPPADLGPEQGPEVFTLLDSATGSTLVTWLKAPHVMQASLDAEAKKESEDEGK